MFYLKSYKSGTYTLYKVIKQIWLDIKNLNKPIVLKSLIIDTNDALNALTFAKKALEKLRDLKNL